MMMVLIALEVQLEDCHGVVKKSWNFRWNFE